MKTALKKLIETITIFLIIFIVMASLASVILSLICFISNTELDDAYQYLLKDDLIVLLSFIVFMLSVQIHIDLTKSE